MRKSLNEPVLTRPAHRASVSQRIPAPGSRSWKYLWIDTTTRYKRIVADLATASFPERGAIFQVGGMCGAKARSHLNRLRRLWYRIDTGYHLLLLPILPRCRASGNCC